MDWELQTIVQETEHPFLNFFTFEYTVREGEKEQAYRYYVASRNAIDSLLAKTKDTGRADGVIIAAVKEEEAGHSVLLIEQYRPALNVRVIEMPAGLVEKGEEGLLSCAKREALEEAGVTLSEVETLCPPSPTSCGLSDEMVAVVVGKVTGIGQRHLERFEDISARFVPLKDVPSLLEDKSRLIALNVRLALLYLLEKYGA